VRLERFSTRDQRAFDRALDAIVARGLRKHGRDRRASRWPAVKRLTPELSAEYQAIAADLSRRMRISRVHLDTFLWIEGR
jgi:hypothetical protein